MPFAKTICCTVFWAFTFTSLAQRPSVFTFQKEDTTIRESLFRQALQAHNALIGSLDKQYKKDYREIYDARFEAVTELLRTSRTISEPSAHNYLQSLLKKITDANPELKHLQMRLIFTRDGWPNAYSLGDGTLAVNAGLVVYLKNEAELVFILCHEIAHFYLDHSNNAIRKNIELIHSGEMKKETKELSMQQYKVGEKLQVLVKKLAFESRRHSRDDEAEADRYAYQFMKRTGFDLKQVNSCLNLLEKIDDTTLYKPVHPEALFHFAEYPFNKKWIQKESSIFSSMKSEDESALTNAEKDSLKTHPDIPQRLLFLKDSVEKAGVGIEFMVDEAIFNHLKKQFIAEIAEQTFISENLSLYLYRCMQLLQKEEYSTYAAYGIVRCLNKLYEYQKLHKLGIVTDKESRGYTADYNVVLRMIDRLRLDEIASLSYYFSEKYSSKLSAYDEFTTEMHKAGKLKQEN